MATRALTAGSRLSPSLTVLGVVDDGGRDKVYLVWNHETICAMACKVYRRPEQARAEARILNRLQHPNIVRCLGVPEEGPPHVLMEFLQGPTLRQLLRTRAGHRLRTGDALRTGVHVASALVHMHRRGYLHLDVKPANIIVVGGRPVLFDVGTAERGRRVRLDCIVGTDDYMAPEQWRRGTATSAADVYGLGVLLYEMLSGRLPFADHRRRGGPPCGAPLPLSTTRRGLARPLNDVVMACLAADARQRPTLPEIIVALDANIRRGPVMLPDGMNAPSTACRVAR